MKVTDLILGAVFAFIQLSPTLAESETRWMSSPHARTRIVSALNAVPVADTQFFLMGWQLQLEKDWKTYWRTPGESGKPPHVSWDGSQNVAAVRLLYSFPERFDIFGLHTYGYSGEVTYPIEVEPLVWGAPIVLKAKIEFLVCNILCVPSEQQYALALPGSSGTIEKSNHYVDLINALHQVPVENEGYDRLDVVDLRLYGQTKLWSLLIRIRGINTLAGAEVVLEDTSEIRFGIPKRELQADPREAVFVVPLQRRSMRSLKFTALVSDGWGNMIEKQLSTADGTQ